MFGSVKQSKTSAVEKGRLNRIEALMDKHGGVLNDKNLAEVVKASVLRRMMRGAGKATRAGALRAQRERAKAEWVIGEIVDRHFQAKFRQAFSALREAKGEAFLRLHGGSKAHAQATLDDIERHAGNLKRKVQLELDRHGVREGHPAREAWEWRLGLIARKRAIVEKE